MLEELNANAVQRAWARTQFMGGGVGQGIEEWLSGQKLSPEQQRRQAVTRAMAAVGDSVDMTQEQRVELALRMGIGERDPEEAAPPHEPGDLQRRKQQSDVIGAEPSKRKAELATRQKKLDAEKKAADRQLRADQKALSEFDERQEDARKRKEAQEADDAAHEAELADFERREEALRDQEWHEQHPVKAEWALKGKGRESLKAGGARRGAGGHVGGHSGAPAAPHARTERPHHAKLERPKRERTETERVEAERIDRERAELAGKLDQSTANLAKATADHAAVAKALREVTQQQARERRGKSEPAL
jgi:hypothetical protein